MRFGGNPDKTDTQLLGEFINVCASNMAALAGVLELVAKERPATLWAVLDELHEHDLAGRRLQEALDEQLRVDCWHEFLVEHPELCADEPLEDEEAGGRTSAR